MSRKTLAVLVGLGVFGFLVAIILKVYFEEVP